MERGWDGWWERELERAKAAGMRAEAARKKAEEARKKKERERAEAEKLAEDLGRVEATTSFDEAYRIAVDAAGVLLWAPALSCSRRATTHPKPPVRRRVLLDRASARLPPS